ncbi:MAG: hypothetical protein ACXWLJ_12285 [Rhizomicrobium sp.]
MGAIPQSVSADSSASNLPLSRLIAKSFMNYWTYATSVGDFAIVERNSRGVDLYFGESFLGHYRNPMAAAEDVGSGSHPTISCAPENGKSLRVPSNLHDWKFLRT